MTAAQCAECGHLHYLGPEDGYCSCPVEGCECTGQDWARSSAPARIFIGRTRTGEAWHYVPRPGTAFPVAACGSFVERSSMRTTDRPGVGIAFHPWQCDKCRNAITREQGQ